MGNPDKEREAYSHPAGVPDEPPPPYSEVAPNSGPFTNDSYDAQRDDDLTPPPIDQANPSDTPSATILFPPSMTIVHSISLTTAHLGVHSKDKRYHITVKVTEITLRSGSKKDSPTLATASNAQVGRVGNTSINVPRETGDAVGLIMYGDHTNCQPFSLRVGSDNHLEHFEWRQSGEKEVENPGHTKQVVYGWKLVRLSSPLNFDLAQENTRRADRGSGFTGDGKEIVATAAFTNKFWKGPNFDFVGTGLTGALGEVFEIVAVITFLRVVSLQLQRSAQGGAPWRYWEEEHPGVRAEREAAEAAGPSGTNKS